MNVIWISRMRFIRRHLSLLLVLLCALILQGQLAIAAHHCQQEDVQTQHSGWQHAGKGMAKTALCDKHCAPDNGQPTVEHPPLLALPVSITMMVVDSPCQQLSTVRGHFKPPAAGPPATIRFCRFRE